MEKFHVVGFKPTEFPDSKTGAIIRGTTVFITSPLSPSVGTGLKAEKIFMKEEIDCSSLRPEIDIVIYFNRYGKASGFQVIEGK